MPAVALFDLDAAVGPLGQDLTGLTANDIDVVLLSVRGFQTSDVLTGAVFTAKVALTDSDTAPTTIQKTWTPTTPTGPLLPSITALSPTAFLLAFPLVQSDTLALLVPRFYSVRVSLLRQGIAYTRTLQTGVVSAVLGWTTLGGAYDAITLQAAERVALTGQLGFVTAGAMTDAHLLAAVGLGCYWKYSGSLGSRSDLNPFTRASTAYQLSASGIWTSVGNNVLRDGHYLLDGLQRTLLERASLNSALWSSDASNAAWGKANLGTLTPVTSCIAGQVAQKLTTAGLGNPGQVFQNIGTFVNGQTDTLYFIVENVNAVASSLGIYDATAGAWVCLVNYTWATGATTLNQGTGTFGSLLLKAVGPNDGALALIWVSGTGTGAGTGAAGNGRRVYLYPTGTGSNALATIFHHGQFEATFANSTSPIVTGAAGVSRSVDSTLNFPFVPTAAQCAALGVTLYDDLIMLRASLQTFQSATTVLGGTQVGGVNIFELWNGSAGEGQPVTAQLRGAAGTTSESDATALAFVPGDRLQRMVTISPLGAVTITVVKNGGSPSTTTGTGLAGGWPAAFTAAVLTLNDNNANRSGDMARTTAVLALGVQTLATMAAL